MSERDYEPLDKAAQLANNVAHLQTFNGIDKDGRRLARMQLARAIYELSDLSESELANIGLDLDDIARWSIALAELTFLD